MTIYNTIKELILSLEPDAENDFPLIDSILELVKYVVGLF